jgi:hypothetical protein
MQYQHVYLQWESCWEMQKAMHYELAHCIVLLYLPLQLIDIASVLLCNDERNIRPLFKVLRPTPFHASE